ncbi:MAG: extracellular solute-binding protein [Rhodospirillaceae bacterium]|nr:extracellular solute-binding protein [Rhodospirillaceae bacterium]
MALMGLTEFKRRLSARQLTRRQVNEVLASVGVVTLGVPLTTVNARAAGSVQVFTWASYKVPELRPGFDATYGQAPGYLLFADNDEAFEKVRSGYRPSIVQPTTYMVGRWREAGLLKPIAVAQLENYNDIFPQLTSIAALRDGSDVFGVPFSWGNSSVLYRKDLAPEYVGNESWTILWDEIHAGRLAQRDSMDAVVLQAALILGIDDPYHMGDEELESVRAKLVEQRELLSYYWISQSDVEQSIASGEIVAAYAWNHAYASLKKQGIDVGYMIPREGILTWVDCTCLIADGPGSEDEAYAYLDAGISAEAGTYMIEEYGYGSANAKAFETANPELLTELGIENPTRLMEMGKFFDDWDPSVRKKATLMFEEIKAGF